MLDTRTSPGPASDATRRDMNGYPAHVVAHEFALTGMKAGADVDPKLSGTVSDRLSAVDRTRRAVECGQESVAGGVDLLAPVHREFPTNDFSMAAEELGPSMIAQLRQTLRRADEIGEQHGCENTIGFFDRANSGQEFLDLCVDDLVLLCHEEELIRIRDLDVFRSVDMLGEIATCSSPSLA